MINNFEACMTLHEEFDDSCTLCLTASLQSLYDQLNAALEARPEMTVAGYTQTIQYGDPDGIFHSHVKEVIYEDGLQKLLLVSTKGCPTCKGVMPGDEEEPPPMIPDEDGDSGPPPPEEEP